MRILVTGANGYLGQGIIKKLLEDGIEVVASDFSMEYVDDRAIKIPGDFGSISSNEFMKHFHYPDAILHLAWKDGFVHASEIHIMDLPRHYAFLRSAVDAGIKRISCMGSMHEIGFWEGCIKADTPCAPQSLYGIAKNALRESMFLLCKQYNVKLQWLRGFYIVGNIERGCSIFSKIVQAAKRGDVEFPFTTGQNMFDFIDYADFCEQVAAVVEQDLVCGIINCCNGKPEKLSSRVERFIEENGYKIKLQYGAFPDRPYDSKLTYGDDEAIKEIMRNKKKK